MSGAMSLSQPMLAGEGQGVNPFPALTHLNGIDVGARVVIE